MFRLMGPHVNSSPGGIPEFTQEWRPAVATVLDPGQVWRGVALAVKTKFVWRFFEAEQPDFNQPIDPKAEAARLVAKRLPQMLQLAGAGGYFQGYNEITISSPEAMRRYAEHEAERLRLLASYGMKGAVGSFAVGNPPEIEWWDDFHPALAAAERLGGVLSLHEYNYPDLEGDEDHLPEWLSLRHRMIYARLPKELRIPLIITECGRDKIFGGDTNGGWRNHMSPAAYLNSLAWYDQELLKDPYVLGACVYCMSAESWEWSYYDVWPDVATWMKQDSAPLYRVVKSAPEPEVKALDVSVHQGMIDWVRVAQAGYNVALVRASVGQWVDAQWKRNRTEAAMRGMSVLPYHFLTVDDPLEEQADAFMAAHADWYPIAYVDLETDKTHGGRGPTDKQAHAFVTMLQDQEVVVGPYSSAYMISKLKIGPWAAALPYPWVADWNPKYAGKPRMPKGWKGWLFQQVTSVGSVPGIAGRVDLDICSQNLDWLQAWYL